MGSRVSKEASEKENNVRCNQGNIPNQEEKTTKALNDLGGN